MCILPLQLFEILVLEFSPFPNKPEMGKKKKNQTKLLTIMCPQTIPCSIFYKIDIQHIFRKKDANIY